MSGYAKAWRSRWDHPLFKTKVEAAVWAWMCDCARFRRHEFQTKFGMVVLERGQILVSQRTIAEEFGLGRQQVRRLFSAMEAAGMISQNSTHPAAKAGTIITIVKYEDYQGDADGDGEVPTQGAQPGQPKANPRPTHNQPTREEREERKEREEGDSAAAESAAAAGEADDLFGDQGDAQPKPQTFPTIEALDLWNTYAGRCGWPTVRKLTETRRDKLRSRLKEIGGLIEWEGALCRAEASDLLHPTGLDPPQWFDFDFLIRNETNVIKLLEGRYDHRRNNGNGSHESRPPAGLTGMAGAAARSLARREGRDGDEGAVRVPAHP